MHELVVVKRVMNTAVKYAQKNNAAKIIGIYLQIGELRDCIDEWVQRYFDYISKDTIAEGAKINIMHVSGVSLCDCGTFVQVTHDNIFTLKCPRCGNEKLNIIRGQEFLISGVEVVE